MIQTLNLTTAGLYLLASLSAWLPLKATAGKPSGDAMAHRWVTLSLLALGILCHGAALYTALFGDGALNLGFSHAVSLIVWLTLISYLLLGQDARLMRLAALYLTPLGVAAALLPLLLPAQHRVPYGANGAFLLHFVVATMSYALFTVATLHALLMLFLEKRLHEGHLTTLDSGLPPLMRVEKLLFRLLTIAFVLLTLTLISGVFFSELLFGKAFQVTHKTVFAVMSWLIFAGLLLGHWRAGWRGKLAIRWTLFGFALLLLSYVGSKFVLEIVLKRG